MKNNFNSKQSSLVLWSILWLSISTQTVADNIRNRVDDSLWWRQVIESFSLGVMDIIDMVNPKRSYMLKKDDNDWVSVDLTFDTEVNGQDKDTIVWFEFTFPFTSLTKPPVAEEVYIENKPKKQTSKTQINQKSAKKITKKRKIVKREVKKHVVFLTGKGGMEDVVKDMKEKEKGVVRLR